MAKVSAAKNQVKAAQVTINQYMAFQAAYDYYNNKLFAGELPQNCSSRLPQRSFEFRLLRIS